MKQISFFLLALQLSISAQSQTSSGFYGLARRNTPDEAVYLATVNPSTGVVTNVNDSSVSTLVNLTGSALDPYRNLYHFMGYNELKSVDMSSGLTVRSVRISNPIADSYFDNFRFNNSDSTLYGLARRNTYDSATMTNYGELYLATINTTSGVITQISDTSVGQGYALAGSAIDPYQMVFYYSTGSHLVGLDMYTGNVYSNSRMILGYGMLFDNFTYSCSDTAIYGMIRQNFYDTVYDPIDSSIFWQEVDSTALYLGRINPSTGVVTTVSPYSIGVGGYSLNSGSTIDPDAMVYYYNNGAQLVGVSLTTGLVVSSQTLTNTNGQYFELMRISANCMEATLPKRTLGTTSVTKTLANSNSISIYPNPASDALFVASRVPVQKLQIFSSVGELALSTTAVGDRVDIQSLPAGMYVVKLSTSDGVHTQKVMKQ
jgi:hypothetical protein